MGSPEMSGYSPEEVKLSPRDALVQSGIAERMIATVKNYKGTLDPDITFGVEDCDFRVEQTIIPAEESGTGKEETHTQVIIEMPNLHTDKGESEPRVTQAFDVEEGKSFGAAGEQPLTQEQWDAIHNILREQNEGLEKQVSGNEEEGRVYAVAACPADTRGRAFRILNSDGSEILVDARERQAWEERKDVPESERLSNLPLYEAKEKS